MKTSGKSENAGKGCGAGVFVEDFMIAELSLLHELSALAYVESEEELFETAVKQVTRLFGARRFALISKRVEKARLLAASGFRGLDDALERLECFDSKDCVLKLVYNRGKADEDIVFFEHTRPMDERTRRLYTIFAGRVHDRLTVFRLKEMREKSERTLREREDRVKKQRTAIAALAVDQAIAEGEVDLALRRITRVTAETIGVDRSGVWLLAEDGTQLRCSLLYDLKKKKYSKGEVLKTSEFPSYFKAIRAESRICVSDAETDPRTRELLDIYLTPRGITALLDGEIQKDGNPAGVFSMEYLGGLRHWHVDEEAFAGMIAALVSQVYANAARRQATEALLQSESMLRKSQEAAGIGSYTVDFRNDICAVSAVLNDILGLPQVEKHPMSALETSIHPGWRDRVVDAHVRAMKNIERFDLEYMIIKGNNGEQRWVHDVGTFEIDELGNAAFMVGTIQDITERKRAEKEKEKLQIQLLQARKMESVGRLAGGIAHDFNNMLGAITGFAEMAMTQVDKNHPICEDLKEICEASAKSADLIRRLLTFARKQAIRAEILDLNESVENTLKMIRRLIGEEIELAWKPGPEPHLVKMDPVQLNQVLVNLCINARDAIGKQGKIIIETGFKVFDETHCAGHAGYARGEYVMLAVSDDGCGMDREVLENVFDPFFTTKSVGKGTGLGLATTYGIVKQNNGFINVYSEPGKGTIFKIYIPMCREQVEKQERGNNKDLLKSGGETVLLVEDDHAIKNVTRRMLRKLGYKVLDTHLSTDAENVAANHPGRVHLLVTDVVMPGINGVDLAERLLALYPDMKVLYMSGYTPDTIANHIDVGKMVNFLQKPFSIGDLANVLKDVLESEDSGNGRASPANCSAVCPLP